MIGIQIGVRTLICHLDYSWFNISVMDLTLRMQQGLLMTIITSKAERNLSASSDKRPFRYRSNALNYFRYINGNVRSAYAKNIPDIKTCHERKDDRIWKFEVKATTVNGIDQYRDKGVKK